jgi:glutamate--cysteine ligase
LLKDNKDNGVLGLELAEHYQSQMKSVEYRYTTANEFADAAQRSLQAQQDIESADTKDFDTFIKAYFSEPFAKKNA